MNIRIHIILLIIYFSTALTYGQSNFRQAMESIDPVPSDTIIELTEKIKIHQAFLDNAIKENDSLHLLLGNIYLFSDNIDAEEYMATEEYLLEAKKIAKQSGNKGWQGWVNYRSGILYIKTDNVEEAIKSFKTSIPLCRMAGDSLCIGESYEQLSILSALSEKFEDAEKYFSLAIPLLEKYGKPRNLCIAYSNRGSILSIKGSPKSAISLFEKSIKLCADVKKNDAVSSNINNLADAYRRLGDYDKAIETYESGLVFNKQHNLKNTLIKNYMGLYYVHKAKGNYEVADNYLIKRYELKDSLMGINVQQQISSLEIKFENQQKVIELQKSKTKILASRNYIRMMSMLMAFLIFIALMAFGHNYRKRQQMKLQIINNEQNLRQIAETLIRKNASIKSLEEKLVQSAVSYNAKEDIQKIEENLFNQTILTADDWTAFKINFNKTYPGFVLKLRSSYALSEAEERLFLLLKLNLTRSEIASMLGVSIETVKKTRSRLRKRLILNSEVSLVDFAKSF